MSAFNVHYQLSSVDEKAYELEMFAIGFTSVANTGCKEMMLLDGCFLNESSRNPVQCRRSLKHCRRDFTDEIKLKHLLGLIHNSMLPAK
ncbi:hypothetical protein ACOSQ2_015650 [Xanthoceras sorbifolium]